MNLSGRGVKTLIKKEKRRFSAALCASETVSNKEGTKKGGRGIGWI